MEWLEGLSTYIPADTHAHALIAFLPEEQADSY